MKVLSQKERPCKDVAPQFINMINNIKNKELKCFMIQQKFDPRGWL